LTSAHQNNTHKIEHQPKNKHLIETIIPRKQTKSNNAVHFLTNSILNDKIKILKIIKRQKKHIIIVGKLVKLVNRVSRVNMTNL
jgi:hypothetical protein